MYSKILILRFPKTEVQKPVVCNLAKSYDLSFNILNATILPRKEGLMVLELFGAKKDFKIGVQYLKDQGVDVQNASQELQRNDDSCIDCGACTAVCPTGALYVDRSDFNVVYDQKKCSVCLMCMPVCPVRCFNVSLLGEAFFEYA